MKHLLLILFYLLVFTVGVNAQEKILSSGSTSEDQTESSKEKTVKEKEPVKSVIKSWTLENQFSTIKPIEVDTSTINFHIYNPIFQKSISNTYLGFAGASYESNIFFQRDNNSEFYFVRNFESYRRSQSEVEYYNTTTPFANLMYVQGSQGPERSEQLFRAFFTQNIDSLTNFGFRFNTLKNQSQYQLLEGNHKFLNAFISRNSKRYNGYFNFIKGTDIATENGGISNATIDRRYSPYQLRTNLSSSIVANTKSLSLFTSHEYLMGRIPYFDKSKRDSVNADVFVPKYGIQYSAELCNYNRNLIEANINKTFFDTSYINSATAHTDSSSFFRLSHIVQLKAFEDNDRKFTFGKRLFLENEIVTAVHPLHFGQRTYSYSNLYAGGEIYRHNSDFWQWSAMARFAFLGRNLGDAIVKGNIIKPLTVWNDTTTLNIEAWYQDRSADIFQEHWLSNHFKWENNFKKQHEVVINGVYHYPRFRIDAGANYTLMSNYLYNNEQALPDQYEKEFSVFTGWLNKDFVLGRFGWSNKAVWQELSDDRVLHLPVWSFYSSIYYSHFLFKVMKIQLGAEIYYHSKFYADSYEPSTTQFYLQNKVKTGGYPQMNLFANAKLKRTSAFVVLSNANSMFNFGDFFSSPSYPVEQTAFQYGQLALKFGFFWTFYD